MPQLIQTILNLIPEKSALLHESLMGILLILLISPIPLIFMLKLAILSVSEKLERKQVLIWGSIAGIVFSLFRLTMPIPFHILPDLIFFSFLIWKLTRIPIQRAIIATLFTQSVVITGSILIVEPIIFLSARNNPNFLYSAEGFAIGAIAETLILLIVIAVFKRKKIFLVKPTSDNS